jgi:hypothetical protein
MSDHAPVLAAGAMAGAAALRWSGVDMRPCTRCGRTDRRRMVALMSLWFAARAGIPPDHGYFYLCPACYRRLIDPGPPALAAEERSEPGSSPLRPADPSGPALRNWRPA